MSTTTVALVLLSVVPLVTGHGYLIDPPGRSSMWRKGFETPINYNDNQLFCGGAYNENFLNHGKCGVCGDPYQGPRENEAGGKYATGTIAKTYHTGQTITVTVVVTANHVGYFEFKLCPNNNPRKAITQDCLDKHVLQRSDGKGSRFYIGTAVGPINVQVDLPAGLRCTQCVLQWRWHTGNSWGVDPNGRGCLGCGPQEEFYGCADIAITNNGQQPIRPVVTDRPYQPVTNRPYQPPTLRPVVTNRPYQPITNRPYQSTTLQPVVTNRPYQPITSRPYQPTTLRPVVTDRPYRPITSRPHVPVQTGKRCFAVNNWAGVPSLDRWCIISCGNGNCPPVYCRCQ